MLILTEHFYVCGEYRYCIIYMYRNKTSRDNPNTTKDEKKWEKIQWELIRVDWLNAIVRSDGILGLFWKSGTDEVVESIPGLTAVMVVGRDDFLGLFWKTREWNSWHCSLCLRTYAVLLTVGRDGVLGLFWTTERASPEVAWLYSRTYDCEKRGVFRFSLKYRMELLKLLTP